jgi:glycosyltransferase involved in cell wall biosynthesis
VWRRSSAPDKGLGAHRLGMKVLHAYNRHRGGGGADDALDATIRLTREGGLDVLTFARDSRDLPDNLAGRVSAFVNGVYSARGVRDFTRFLHESRPDVVHVHELFPLISPWIIPRCAEAGVPVVMTCYDFRLTCPIATHFRKGEICHKCLGGRQHWAVLRNCRGHVFESLAFGLRSAVAERFGLFTSHVSTYIVVSDFCARWIVEQLGVDPAKIVLVPCGLPMPETTVDDPSRGEYVAFAGRLAHEKGVDVLIEAAHLAGLPLRIAASAASVQAVPPDIHLDEGMLVLTKSREELEQFYRGARLLVAPSIWYETFGLVPAEAMSHGIPVIVSKIGALQESVEDGVSGFWAEPGNPRDLADKMLRIWNDPVLCRSMGMAAARRARERCAESAHFRGLVTAYRHAMASGVPSNGAATAG